MGRISFIDLTGGYSTSKISLESFNLEDDLVNEATGEVVGDASEEIPAMVQEADEISGQVDSLQTASQSTDVGERVAAAGTNIANRGTPATMEEAALIQAGVEQTMTAAGATPTEAAEQVASVAQESSGGYNIAMEGFLEVIQRIWQNIKEFASRLYNNMKDAFNRWWNSTASVMKRAKKLKDLLEKKKDEFTETKPTISLSGSTIKALTPTATIRYSHDAAIKTFSKNYTSFKFSGFKEMVSEFCKTGSDICKQISDKDKLESSARSEILKLLDGVTKNIPKSEEGKEDKDVSKYLGGDMSGNVKTLALGNKCVVYGFDSKAAKAVDNNDYEALPTLMSSISNKVVDYHKSFSPQGKDAKEAKAPSFSEIRRIPELVESAMKNMEDYYNKDTKTMKSDVDKLEKELDETVKKANDSWDGVRKNYAKAIQKLYLIPTQVIRASMSVCVHTVQTSNALLTLGFTFADKMKKDKDD